MTYLDKEIEQLDINSQKLLCMIAYNVDKTPSTVLIKIAQLNNLTEKQAEKLLNELVRKGICSKNNYNKIFYITPLFFVPTLRFLVKQHEEWIDFIKKYREDIESSDLIIIRDLVISLLQGKKIRNAYRNIFNPYHNFNYIIPIALYPELYPLIINNISKSYLGIYIDRVVAMLFNADITDKYDTVLELIDYLTNMPVEEKEKAKEIVALYRYYAFGEYNPIGKGNSLFDCILRAIYALHTKDYDIAESMFTKALKIRNKDSNIKNVFTNMLTCYFLIAYYIKSNADKNKKKIQQFLNKKDIVYNDSLLPAYIVASWHNNYKHEIDNIYLHNLHKKSKYDDHRALQTMANYLSAALDDSTLTRDSIPLMPRHAIMQHEFQYFLDIDEDRLKELNKMFGKPILFDNKPMQRWEIILNDIIKDSQTGNINDTKEENKNSRIVYILRGWYVVIREQTRKANGEWYAGKEISMGKYAEGYLDSMDDIDKKIWRINNGLPCYIYPEKILPYLVGSDRVMTGHSAPFTPVTVEEEKPFLLVERSKRGFSISSNLPDLDERNEYVRKLNDTHYVVIRIDKLEKPFFTKLLELKNLPLEAEDKLKEMMSILGNKIQIVSPLMEDNHNIEIIDSTNEIVVQVNPENGYIFNILLYAKPNPDIKGLYEPGKGESIIYDRDNDGNLKKVKRNLKKELTNMRIINNFFIHNTRSNMSSTTFSGDLAKTPWTLQLHDMLKTMEYVNEHSDIFSIEWPEGEKLKMTTISEQQWNINLHKESNWFKIEGEIEIDDKLSLQIEQLMQMTDLSQTQNYVRLNEKEFIKLTESMSKCLTHLQVLAVKDKNEFRIPVTNALLLNDTLGDDLPIAKSENLKEVLKEIHKSYKLNPQAPHNLQATLRNYQLKGYRWMMRLDSWGAGACLADDMGLGKTIQTIAVLLNKAKKGASLVLAPTSVISNWKNEIERFAPSLHTVMLNEMDSDTRAAEVKKASANDVLLVTYGIVCTETDILSKKTWNVVCLDEAHTIKNRETKTAQAVYLLNSETKIALTGTPLQNHLGELWSLFNFINPGMLGSYESFRQRFVIPIENGDKERQQLLRRIVLPFILRRTKKEVVKELPEKTEIIYKVELSPEEIHTYEYIRNKAKRQLEEEHKVSVSVLAEITKLRLAACAIGLVRKELNFHSSKLEQMMHLVNEIYQGNNRILIFSQFTSFLKMVKERLDEEKIDYLYLDGTTTMKQREDMVKRFQNGEGGIFIISLKAGGLGLNLTGANYVIHMDPWWNPAIEQQATDRAYRIGQNQEVTVYHLIASHTIEEKILRLHQTKRDLSDSLLEGADVSHKLTEEDLRELLS